MTKKSYILVNNNVAYANGSSWWLNVNEPNLVNFGYTKLSSAKSALRRLKADSGHGWIWGYLNPNNWEIKTIEETKTVNIY